MLMQFCPTEHKKSSIPPAIAIMKSFDLLTSLPTCLSCSILRDWLSLKTVVTLDSAHCCRSHRTDVLQLLQSDEYSICEQLSIANNKVCSVMLKRFGGNLRSVIIGQAALNAEHEELLMTHCHRLQRIKFVNGTDHTPRTWALLSVNPHIESISIVYVNYESLLLNVSFENIVLPKLRALAVNGYHLEDEHIFEPSIMRNIVRLDLSESIFTSSVLLRLVGLCPRLKSLKLSYTVRLAHATLHALTVSSPWIAHLDLSINANITDVGILSVVQNLKDLQSLNIGGVRGLTDTSLVHIYTHCAGTLHTLRMSCIEKERADWGGDTDMFDRQFSAAGINTMLERCTQLRTLYLHDRSERLEDATPISLTPTAVSHLTTLVLSGYAVSDQNLATIGKYGTNLRILVLDKYHTHTTELLSGLVHGCPCLRELHYKLSYRQSKGVFELTPAFLMQIKPGLRVELIEIGWDASQHDVMNL